MLLKITLTGYTVRPEVIWFDLSALSYNDLMLFSLFLIISFPQQQNQSPFHKQFVPCKLPHACIFLLTLVFGFHAYIERISSLRRKHFTRHGYQSNGWIMVVLCSCKQPLFVSQGTKRTTMQTVTYLGKYKRIESCHKNVGAIASLSWAALDLLAFPSLVVVTTILATKRHWKRTSSCWNLNVFYFLLVFFCMAFQIFTCRHSGLCMRRHMATTRFSWLFVRIFTLKKLK